LVLYNSEYRPNYNTKFGGNLSRKELANKYINVSYVSNKNGSYFIYYVVSPYKFTRIVLNNIRDLTLLETE